MADCFGFLIIAEAVRAVVLDLMPWSHRALESALASAVLVATAAISTPGAQAHPGGLNSEGCHNNRADGTYHCHRNRQTQQPTNRARPDNSSTYYRNCAAARAAGAAPLYRGQPGYRPGLDRDDDGVACEPSRGRP